MEAAQQYQLQNLETKYQQTLKQFNSREAKARDHHKKALELEMSTEKDYHRWAQRNAPAVIAAYIQWEDVAKQRSAFKQHLGRPEVQDERNQDTKRSCKFTGRVHPGITDNSDIKDISQDF